MRFLKDELEAELEGLAQHNEDEEHLRLAPSRLVSRLSEELQGHSSRTYPSGPDPSEPLPPPKVLDLDCFSSEKPYHDHGDSLVRTGSQ